MSGNNINASNDYLFKKSSDTKLSENESSKNKPLIKAFLESVLRYGLSKLVDNIIFFDPYSNFPDGNGKTALMYAVQKGDVQMVTDILQKERDISARDKSGKTALMYSATNDNAEVLNLLIKHGAQVNDKDNKGRTPLMFACKRGNLEALEKLLSHGAHVNELDLKGRNALMHALDSGEAKEKVVEALLKNKDTKYVTDVMHLFDPYCFFRIGHIATLLINNTGDGILYSYANKAPQNDDAHHNIKYPVAFAKGRVFGYNNKDVIIDVKSYSNKNPKDLMFDGIGVLFNGSIPSELEKVSVAKEQLNDMKIQTSDWLKSMSVANDCKYYKIYRYCNRTLMKIDGTTPVQVAVRGAHMQRMAENIVRNPGKFHLYTNNCMKISQKILKEGNINPPKSFFPSLAYKKEIKEARQNKGWIIMNKKSIKKSHKMVFGH